MLVRSVAGRGPDEDSDPHMAHGDRSTRTMERGLFEDIFVNIALLTISA